MKFSLSKSLLWLAAIAAPVVSAERIIESKSLNPCMSNSSFSATLFNVAFTPSNRSLGFKIEGISNIAGKIEADIELLVYGYSAMNQKLDPCGQKELEGMCPMNAGPLTIKSNIDISQDIMSIIPGKTRLELSLNFPNTTQASHTQSPTLTQWYESRSSLQRHMNNSHV
jgi:hypothetical protein